MTRCTPIEGGIVFAYVRLDGSKGHEGTRSLSYQPHVDVISYVALPRRASIDY